MMVTELLNRVLEGAIILLEAGIGALAMLMLFHAALDPFARDVRHPSLDAVRTISHRAAGPVRTMLPRALQSGRYDYAPMITVLLLILIGFGFEAFLDVLRTGW